MPAFNIHHAVPVERTVRVQQLEGLFDLPPAPSSEVRLSGNLPLEEQSWTIGLIHGPSGSGKSTLARQLFGTAFGHFEWPPDRSVVDAFPAEMNIRQITGLLSSVGFSSPPAWLRPFRVLSMGEQFRATLARVLATPRGTVVVDEFTSVVDRTVARIGAAAVSKAIRRRESADFRLVAVSCHDDIVAWLDPDWTYVPAADAFQWRRERRPRPPVPLEILRTRSSSWKPFKHHHYLSRTLHPAARCFVGRVENRPAAFTAVLHFPHPRRPGWREHRTVCLPDYQGIGIGNAMSEFVASLFVATGKPYRSTTSHPAMIRHRARSVLWNMIRAPGISRGGFRRLPRQSTPITPRMTASFEYAGQPNRSEAIAHGIMDADGSNT
jgi:alpha-D-ribose 1-methylphosphonate 5-triphosphate synthase subunit PhnL